MNVRLKIQCPPNIVLKICYEFYWSAENQLCHYALWFRTSDFYA